MSLRPDYSCGSKGFFLGWPRDLCFTLSGLGFSDGELLYIQHL